MLKDKLKLFYPTINHERGGKHKKVNISNKGNRWWHHHWLLALLSWWVLRLLSKFTSVFTWGVVMLKQRICTILTTQDKYQTCQKTLQCWSGRANLWLTQKISHRTKQGHIFIISHIFIIIMYSYFGFALICVSVCRSLCTDQPKPQGKHGSEKIGNHNLKLLN